MHLGLIWADNVLLKMTFHEEYEFVICVKQTVSYFEEK